MAFIWNIKCFGLIQNKCHFIWDERRRKNKIELCYCCYQDIGRQSWCAVCYGLSLSVLCCVFIFVVRITYFCQYHAVIERLLDGWFGLVFLFVFFLLCSGSNATLPFYMQFVSFAWFARGLQFLDWKSTYWRWMIDNMIFRKENRCAVWLDALKSFIKCSARKQFLK